jgi:hypothetical protein
MIQFIHEENFYSVSKEQVVTHIYQQLCNHIPLPDKIIVVFKSLGETYGEAILDPKMLNKRIVLNVDLTAKELFYPTIHEMVHISQMHTKRLQVSRSGVFLWDNQTYPINPNTLTYEDYKQLPWEVDAYEQQIILGKKLLENQ